MRQTVFCVFYTHPSNMIKNGGHGFSALHAIFDSLQKARDYIDGEREAITKMLDYEEDDYKNDLMTLSFEIKERVLQ